MERRSTTQRRRVTVATHIRMMLTIAVCFAGVFGLGIIFASVFMFTEKEFWANVAWVFGK